MSGDGHEDLITGSYLVDVSGVVDAGAMYTFACGPGTAGLVTPTATYTIPSPTAHDFLGRGQPYMFDFTGDGDLDLLVGAPLRDVGGVVDSGAAFLWEGPIQSTQPPLALEVPGAQPGDLLGL